MLIQLYVHIPFCLRKCGYCDFNSVSSFPVAPSEYAAALLREMELRRKDLDDGPEATTLYFGGGTPSLLSPDDIGRIIDQAANRLGLSSSAEVTLEANPGTVTEESFRGYRRAGVTRISLGVQSFSDPMLRQIGRIHSGYEAVAAFEAAVAAGFDAVGIDLIHSLPHQTLPQWEEDLQTAISLSPTHISAYALTVEPGTPFGDLEACGKLVLPTEEEGVAMFRRTPEILAVVGYDHYEISNFARPGFRSRHNEGYWRRRSYLGFGAGAHSFLADRRKRWGNVDDIGDYLRAIGTDRVPVDEVVALSARDEMSEWMFLGLRLLDGVRSSAFATEFGVKLTDVFGEEIETLLTSGLLLQEGDLLRLDPDAVVVSNQVFSSFV